MMTSLTLVLANNSWIREALVASRTKVKTMVVIILSCCTKSELIDLNRGDDRNLSST